LIFDSAANLKRFAAFFVWEAVKETSAAGDITVPPSLRDGGLFGSFTGDVVPG
jgi:hypothetical protein